MRNPKYCIAIDEHERRIIIGGLNNPRNKPVSAGRYTDNTIDDAIVKVVHAPIGKFKARITEDWIMKKTIFGQTGGIYHEKNGYLIPGLSLPPEEKHIGIWGQVFKQ